MYAIGTETFKVLAVSKNTNSFGLKNCIMVSKRGICYSGCANYLNVPKQDTNIEVPVSLVNNGLAKFDFVSLGFELVERLEDCPEDVIREVFRNEEEG